MNADSDSTVTPEEIEAAKRAWAAENRVGAVAELFARPVVADDGSLGDVAISHPTSGK